MANKRDIFVAEIEKAFNEIAEFTLSEDALAYFEALKNDGAGPAKKFTENGKIVLAYMKENKDSYNNLFKAKDFEGANITSKSASGAMRKLVSDGYCEKMGQSPVIYSLTTKGEEVSLDEE